MVVLRTTFSYIRGSGSHIFRKIYLQFMSCIIEGLLLDIVKIELAENKVLRNDLAAPRSGVGGHRSSERPYFCLTVLILKNSPSNT